LQAVDEIIDKRMKRINHEIVSPENTDQCIIVGPPKLVGYWVDNTILLMAEPLFLLRCQDSE